MPWPRPFPIVALTPLCVLGRYGDGSSISGNLYTDVVSFGNYTTQGNQVVFGGINNVDAPNGFEAVHETPSMTMASVWCL